MGQSAPSTALQTLQTEKSDLYTAWLCCHSEGPQEAGDIGREESDEVQQKKYEVLYWGKNNPKCQYVLRVDPPFPRST